MSFTARPPKRPPPRTGPAHAGSPRTPRVEPIDERELDELQALLDGVPAPLEPLDVSMLDGFLCGVLLQPRRVEPSQWLPRVVDVEARPWPSGAAVARVNALALRRHAELDAAIQGRQWFDPWVFELEAADEDAAGRGSEDDATGPAAVDSVYPWVAGFATALELYPGLMALAPQQLNEPLALVYRHLGADDLEDADELLEVIDGLEPPADLGEAVEDLVRAVLLLADVSRPVVHAPARGRMRRP